MLAMRAKPPANWRTAHSDLQRFHSTEEFVEDVQSVLFKHLSDTKKLKTLGSALADEVRGADLQGLKLMPTSATWKTRIHEIFSDLNESTDAIEPKLKFVFFWDEFPFMLDNIARREGADQAMEVLDCVRALEAGNSNIRLVLTGSIGLHHVLKALQAKGYHNSPLNRFSHEQPGPHAPDAATDLAQALLLGERLLCSDRLHANAQLIARSVGYVGFYIHKLISRLPITRIISAELIQATLRREIANVGGDWDLAHYRQRLEKYYGSDAVLALYILDSVAHTQPIGFAQIKREISGQLPELKPQQVASALRLLVQDHYLVLDGQQNYRFYLDLIRAWWQIDRQLELAEE